MKLALSRSIYRAPSQGGFAVGEERLSMERRTATERPKFQAKATKGSIAGERKGYFAVLRASL